MRVGRVRLWGGVQFLLTKQVWRAIENDLCEPLQMIEQSEWMPNGTKSPYGALVANAGDKIDTMLAFWSVTDYRKRFVNFSMAVYHGEIMFVVDDPSYGIAG